MTSLGKIYEYGQAGMTTAKLYNFQINKFDLKTEHKNWLINAVAPRLKNGGSISIVGLASRTGSDALNMKLSENRMRTVVNLLRQLVPNNFKVATELAVGERAAMLAGVKDGVEDEGWRGVVISAWDKPIPPPPPPPPPIPPRPVVSGPPIDKSFNKRWFGLGVKAGGQLGIGGVESTAAYMVNLGDAETFRLEVISSRWGIGLGGSGGAVAVFGFGFNIPYELDHKPLKDWGINIAYTEKIFSKSVLHAIQGTRFFVDTIKKGVYLAPKFKQAQTAAELWNAVAHFRDLFHVVFAELEAGKGKGMGVVIIDIPFAGKGLELSAFLTRGTMYASNASHWIGPDD
ncbi:MAG: hypothetical protein ABIR33_16980 [Pyrinomonadaceae bacterium]